MALKRIIPLTAIVILLLISATVPALALVPNGQRASEFQLTDLSSNVHALSSYRGKVVVIDFFMVSCSACKEDAKMNLVPLYAKSYSGDAKVQFLSVETSNANAATVRNTYLKDTGVPWPVLTGGGGLIKTYNFVGVPTIYVIDSTGKVALTMSYPTNVQTLKSTIDRLEHGTTTPAKAPTSAKSNVP
jgi:peroxiredoxin